MRVTLRCGSPAAASGPPTSARSWTVRWNKCRCARCCASSVYRWPCIGRPRTNCALGTGALGAAEIAVSEHPVARAAGAVHRRRAGAANHHQQLAHARQPGGDDGAIGIVEALAATGNLEIRQPLRLERAARVAPAVQPAQGAASLAEGEHAAAVGALPVKARQCVDAALARRADARDRLDVLAGEDGGFILQQRLQLTQQARLLFENAAQVLLDVSALERHVAR